MQTWTNRALAWAPPALAFVFLVTVVASQGAIRESLNSHADYASAPMIAELLSHAAPGRVVTLGDYAWYEALWLLLATKWLPSHQVVWDLIPFVLWLLTAAIAALTVRRVASRWAAATTAALVICAGLGMRNAVWSLDTHGPVGFHVALLGLALVLAIQRPAWLRGARGYVAAVVLGLVTAVGATDQLLVLCGLGPLVFAALVVWLRRGEAATMRLVAVVTVVALVGAKLMIHAGESAGLIKDGKAFTFVAPDGAIGHLGLLPAAVSRLVANSPFGQPINATNALMMGAGLAGLLTLVAVFWITARVATRGLWPERFAVAGGAGPAALVWPVPAAPSAEPVPADEPEARDSAASAWLAILVFFAAVIAANLLAWIFTSAPIDQYGARYLVSGWIGVCVLLPLLGERLQLRWLAGLLATLLCFAATFDLVREPRPTAESHFADYSIANGVTNFAAKQGAKSAYAGFWDAMSVTVNSKYDTKVYPIVPCPTAEQPSQNCPHYLHTISSWYAPKPGPSILLIDPTQPLQPALDPRYGKPIATEQIGPMTAYAFAADISPYIGGGAP